jgi:hypothetical protein
MARELFINLKTAKALGITVPPSLRASETAVSTMVLLAERDQHEVGFLPAIFQGYTTNSGHTSAANLPARPAEPAPQPSQAPQQGAGSARSSGARPSERRRQPATQQRNEIRQTVLAGAMCRRLITSTSPSAPAPGAHQRARGRGSFGTNRDPSPMARAHVLRRW